MTTATANALYVIFACGALAVYFLLPEPRREHRLIGATLGVVAIVSLMLLVGQKVIATGDGSGYFYLFATIAVAAATRVITHPKPVFSALYFVLVVVSVAALMVLQQAELLALALIIIYAGAILVTYLFVIMLAHAGGSPVYDQRAREPFAAVLAGFVLMGAIAGRAGDLPVSKRPVAIPVADSASTWAAKLADSNTLAIGAAVMTKYVVVLELAGLLLLIAMVGAIALSRKRVPVDPAATARRPLGEVGRKVDPF